MFQASRRTVRQARWTGFSRAWVITLVLTVAIPVGIWAALQQLKVPPPWMAVAAAASAIAPLLVTGIRQVRSQTSSRDGLLSRHLRLWSKRSGVPAVSDINDPVALGVKPATAEPGIQATWLPPYIPREADERLDEMLAFSRFVLIVGDSAAGKSRTAFEAMRRRFCNRAIVIPARADSLGTLLNAGLEFHNAVVWLDDLDSYLGTETFTLVDLERLVGTEKQAVTVLATIRKAAYDRFDQDAAISERKLLRTAAQLPLHRELTYTEQAAAEVLAKNDPQLGEVLERLNEADSSHRYGLAEYLAAAPELIRRFDHADDVDGKPIGVAIVRAAIDWRRVGLTRPIPVEALRTLYPLYLSVEDTNRTDENSFAEALTWATQRVVASSALLVEEPQGYRAFDYLLDYVERNARFLLPSKLLENLRSLVAPEEAHLVGLALVETYRQTGQEAALTIGQTIGSVAAGGRVVGIEIANAETSITDPTAAMLRERGLLLPPDIANFTGRADVVESAVNDLLHRGITTIVLTGLGGIGKTATAVRLAHLLRDRGGFSDASLFIRLRSEDGHDLAPDDVIADLAAALGAPGHQLRVANRDDLVNLYRQKLSSQRMVFVLDDATSSEQVLPLLPPAPNITVITSRRPLDLPGAENIVLDVLSQAESLALLQDIVGRERINTDLAGARAVVQLTGYLPLAIRIAGAMIHEDPNLTLTEFASTLANATTMTKNLSYRGMAVRAPFELSYRKLTTSQARTFRFIALIPGIKFTTRQVAALLNTTLNDAQSALNDLVKTGMLRSIGIDSYQMHDLLRSFAVELGRELDADETRASALGRLAELEQIDH
jgi:NB-ARC domain